MATEQNGHSTGTRADRVMTVIIIVMLSLMGTCAYSAFKHYVPNYGQSYAKHGFSLDCPTDARVTDLGSPSLRGPVSDQEGRLVAKLDGKYEHTMTLTWRSDIAPPTPTSEKEIARWLDGTIQSLVGRQMGFYEKSWVGETVPMTARISGHKAVGIPWSYLGMPVRGGSAQMYGATALMYCPESKRLFQFDVLSRTNKKQADLLEEYVRLIECHQKK